MFNNFVKIVEFGLDNLLKFPKCCKEVFSWFYCLVALEIAVLKGTKCWVAVGIPHQTICKRCLKINWITY